jgi:hypothetical protein
MFNCGVIVFTWGVFILLLQLFHVEWFDLCAIGLIFMWIGMHFSHRKKRKAMVAIYRTLPRPEWIYGEEAAPATFKPNHRRVS